MRINLFKITLKGFFDHLDFINKSVSLSVSAIKNYILPAMSYVHLNFNLLRWTYLEHVHVKRKFFKKVCNKVEFLF